MAVTYTLDLKIDANSLHIFRTVNMKIVLAKLVGGGNPNVIWGVFEPFETNKVEWTEEFGLYASPTKIENGAEIHKYSEVFPAQDAAYYSFNPDYTFSGPFTGSGASGVGQLKVNNHMPKDPYSTLTFGLEQKVTLNGTVIDAHPINIVPADSSITFIPLKTIFVWTQNFLTSGTVITQIYSKRTSVTFGESKISQTLAYDPQTGGFLPSNADGKQIALEKTPHVKLHTPPGVFSVSNK
jgi:hypothetical protein